MWCWYIFPSSIKTSAGFNLFVSQTFKKQLIDEKLYLLCKIGMDQEISFTTHFLDIYPFQKRGTSLCLKDKIEHIQLHICVHVCSVYQFCTRFCRHKVHHLRLHKCHECEYFHQLHQTTNYKMLNSPEKKRECVTIIILRKIWYYYLPSTLSKSIVLIPDVCASCWISCRLLNPSHWILASQWD